MLLAERGLPTALAGASVRARSDCSAAGHQGSAALSVAGLLSNDSSLSCSIALPSRPLP